jgi:hypothetical protein
MERTSSWTATLQEQKLEDQDDQIYHDEPEDDQMMSPEHDESLVRSEDNSKTQVSASSDRQNVPNEPDDDGFIQVTKNKRRGKNQTGYGHDLE